MTDRLTGISPADLQRRVEALVLPTLPEGHTSGVVVHADLDGTLTLSAIQRVGDHVEVVAQIDKRVGESWDGQAQLRASW